MIRILVFGASGQLGSALTETLPEDIRLTGVSRHQLDLRKPDRCTDIIDNAACDVVVNAAAVTAVDAAERDLETAWQVNAAAPGLIARACQARGLPLIQISTDYVFAGRSGHELREDDPVEPLNVYGRSKLAGEEAVRIGLQRHVILRTSGLFGMTGKSFLATMLRLASERSELRIVHDQLTGPTPAWDLARAVFAIARRFEQGDAVSGTFHYGGRPPVSWADFAKAIFEACLPPGKRPRVQPITTEEYGSPAQRPPYSALDCRKIEAVYGLAAPDWRDGLRVIAAAHLPLRVSHAAA